MDWHAVTFDWNRARAFLVTAEEGSLSAAARALGLAQPTLGRQVRALVEELGVALFERVGRSLSLTPGGLELAEHVRAMGEAATRVSLSASGRSQSIEGSVRITASEITAAHVLPPVIAQLRAAEPGIAVEIVASNSLADLRRREADIAIRNPRPTDPDLIARKLSDDSGHLYASHGYLRRAGRLDTPEALAAAEFVGFADNDRLIEALNGRGIAVGARNFPLLTGSHLVLWELVRQGLGIGVMASGVGDAEPLVRRAAPWMDPFAFEVWLVAHRELRTSRRIRLVFDWLADALGDAARTR
ncbi:MAG: LysR family transcriptional regulator [Thalassobaculum sp.]|uniref:LysR family transcriptional regulator n=1 Tax=Thalassobaculum sp. TaxID=2022740 RepID=UPI0032EA9A36